MQQLPGHLVAQQMVAARWVQAVVMLLGLWLITSALSFTLDSRALFWSDLVSGAALIALALPALRGNHPWPCFVQAVIGLWLLIAPLVFWAPTALSYANDTLVGVLTITFVLVIPTSGRLPGPTVPPGWSYNPSTWVQRTPIITLGFISFFVARYMASYQLGYLPWAWDPFFGEGTVQVLDSDISHAFPVSDAGLGAVVYLIESLSAFGDETRWRTTPWMVAVFGFAVVPLGVVSIILIILQPVAVGAWCFLCLVTAALMLLMVCLALDEVIAMLQFLHHSRRAGKSVWQTFWMGGTVEGAQMEPRFDRQPAWQPRSALWGVTGSWNLYLSIVIGAWLMFAPAVLGSQGPAANSNHVAGALAITFGVIALAEVGRPARFLNLLFGAWLIISPWFLPGGVPVSQWNSLLCGALLVLLCFRRGKIQDHYGSYDRFVR